LRRKFLAIQRPELSLEARAAVVPVTNSLPKGGGESGTLAYTAICSLRNFSPDPMHVPVKGSSYTSPNSWGLLQNLKVSSEVIYWNNMVAKKINALLCESSAFTKLWLGIILCSVLSGPFATAEVLLIHTYRTSSHLWAMLLKAGS